MKLDNFPVFVGVDATPIITTVLLTGITMVLGFTIGLLIITVLSKAKFAKRNATKRKFDVFGGAFIVSLTVIAGAIAAPTTYISSAQDHASAVKSIHTFQSLVERQYGLRLSTEQAETLADYRAHAFAPGVKAYGHTKLKVNGKLTDVGLYKQAGVFKLVDRQELADGLESASLPRVAR